MENDLCQSIRNISAFGINCKIISKNDLALICKYRNCEHIRYFMDDQREVSLNVLNFWHTKIENKKNILPYIVSNNKNSVAYMEIKNIKLDEKTAEFGIFIFSRDDYGTGLSERIALCWEIILKKIGITTCYSHISNENIRSINFFKKIGGVLDKCEGNYIILKHEKTTRRNALREIALKLNLFDEYCELLSSNRDN